MSDYAEVKRNIVRNTISNYVRTLTGLVVGLVSFRLIYQSLSQEEFGFWSLLWSVFGYGVLLDFGFGFAAQKRVAELSVAKDWPQLSRVLSTIIFFYFGVALLLGAVVLAGSEHIIGWFGVSPGNTVPFRHLLVVFFIGIGLAFPMGVFPEILRGQQRIRLANYITTDFLVLRLALLALASWLDWGFMAIMLIALRWMPEVRISPRLFSTAAIGETAAFSIFAYIATATNLVASKADQVVLGTALGIGAIAVYQAGAKVAEIFREFAKQMQDSLSPAAAHLHASQNHEALRDLLVRTTRWAAITATPLYLLCALHMDELLHVLTGDPAIHADTWWTGQVILLWFCTCLFTHSVQRIYIVTGRERKLVRLGISEALLNVALSITLVLTFRNVVCVAIGSLIPTLLIGWGVIWPWLARDTRMTQWQLLQRTMLPTWLSCLPALGVLIALQSLPALNLGSDWATLLVHGPIGAALAYALVFRFAMTPTERALIASKIPFLKPAAPLTPAVQEAV
ncbi:MAG: lipopolysaccharide biosynthesis protein [Roseimicrobium sp.]